MQPHLINRTIDEALQHQAGGRLQEAERLYLTVLAAEPRHAEANHNLGVLLLGMNRLPDALRHLKIALEVDPRDGQLWVSYVDALIHAGQYQEARTILASGRQRGLSGGVVDSLQRRLDILGPEPAAARPSAASGRGPATFAAEPSKPGSREKALVAALRREGRYEEALQAARAAVRSAPDDAQCHLELGRVLDRMGQTAEAAASVRRALQLNPGDAEAHNQLGLMLDRTAHSREAEACYRRALALRPDWPAAQSNLAIALTYQNRLEEAAEVFRRVVALEPPSTGALVNLALVLARQGKPTEAEAALRRALTLEPDHGGAHVDLARILRDTNRVAEAEDSLRRAIERFPLMTEARSDLLHSLNFNAERSPQYCLEEARRYGKAVQARVKRAYASWTCASDPVRLRVGITPGDIHAHPVGYFLEGVLGHLDRGRIELIGYPTNPKADALTERVRPCFAEWRPLNGVPDEAAARQIHHDGIHVLIELSGHTPHNRLPMLAWKPAPVQVNWLGYFATTGVTEIDYFLADPVSVPPEHRCHFTESVWYLPDTRLCFTPPDCDVPVSPLPALRDGFITFGSFQGLAKLNDRTLSLWARVMDAVPGARLRIQSRGLASKETQETLTRRLEAVGIAAGRIALHGQVSRPAYLAAHGEVDFVLDALPFTGGTTTCEALWMGVPTLTIAGDRLVSRQGASLMRAAGLPDWVADNEDSFVAQAAAFAAEPHRLGEIRAGLRRRLPDTPLFDARRFASNLETALWQMWQKWRQGR